MKKVTVTTDTLPANPNPEAPQGPARRPRLPQQVVTEPAMVQPTAPLIDILPAKVPVQQVQPAGQPFVETLQEQPIAEPQPPFPVEPKVTIEPDPIPVITTTGTQPNALLSVSKKTTTGNSGIVYVANEAITPITEPPRTADDENYITLGHTYAWAYDLKQDPRKLIARCCKIADAVRALRLEPPK